MTSIFHPEPYAVCYVCNAIWMTEKKFIRDYSNMLGRTIDYGSDAMYCPNCQNELDLP